ncbi:SDR family oxidoreductase [Gammaproteobacteria bacterium]|nr:SDR family oxidoreductase [Gammaproteobacteria bacterium]
MSKNILIIGASSSIGAAIINLATADGHTIFATSRSEDLASEYDNFMHIDPNDNLDALDNLPEDIHGLVYCPGSINLKSLQRLTLDEMKEEMDINFFGAFNILKKVLPNLKKNEGASVVLFSTVAVNTGMPMHSSIASSKAALEGLAITLAAELAPRVAVNCVAPSIVDTKLAEHILSTDERKQASADRHPLKTIGNPLAIAKTAYHLLDAKDNWITGQIIAVDGGLSSLKT